MEKKKSLVITAITLLNGAVLPLLSARWPLSPLI